jgi:ribosomal protein S10
MRVKILIALKSFEARLGFAPSSALSQSSDGSNRKRTKSNIVSIALPKAQSIFTVLRSPHIDKKSRDQFDLTTHKQLIIINTEIKQIREKLFNLKFHEIPGVQMKIIFQTKTRL